MGSKDTTDSAPWKGQRKFLKDVFSQAQDQFGDELGFFPGSTVAGRSAQGLESEQAGLNMIRGQDFGGLGAADQYSQDVLGGKYLSPDTNPWLKQMGDQGAQDITRHFMRATAPGTSMASMGRGGSGSEMNRQFGAQQALGGELSQFYGNLYGGNYARERGAMGQAAGMQPGLAAARRADVGFGAQMGQSAEQYDQRLLNDLIRRFEYQRDEPSMRLGRYSDIVQKSGAIPGTSTVSRGFGAAEGLGLGIGAIGALGSAGVICSKELKVDIDGVDSARMLDQIELLPIRIWKYKPEVDTDVSGEHIGPYAEDMQRLFGVGDGKTIFLMDMLGVAVSGIQALTARVKDLEKQVAGEGIPVEVD